MDLDEAIRWLDKGVGRFEKIESSQQMCDWCDVASVTYSNEAHDLCENSSDQLHRFSFIIDLN